LLVCGPGIERHSAVEAAHQPFDVDLAPGVTTSLKLDEFESDRERSEHRFESGTVELVHAQWRIGQKSLGESSAKHVDHMVVRAIERHVVVGSRPVMYPPS
jgi:hypothetical protein